MDRFKIDGHKLNYHPDRLSQWRTTGDAYPLYMEISPTGSCNHRCTFCGLDFMEYQNRRIETGLLKERLTELGVLGLKSVMYGGEGEPLLHPDMEELALHTKGAGIDLAFTTNAVPLTPNRAEAIVTASQWIKVSLNAGSAASYAAIHRTNEGDFEKVFANLAHARTIREETHSPCALGAQAILLKENLNGMVALARRVRDMGLDYLVIKPYSPHPQSHIKGITAVDENEATRLADELAREATNDFPVIFRTNAMMRAAEEEKPYCQCLALPFWSYIDAGGGVWGCSVFLGDERFYYGNIYEEGFRQIWEGERRKTSLAFVANELDASHCRTNCRMDAVNRYLHDLADPPPHVNFI